MRGRGFPEMMRTPALTSGVPAGLLALSFPARNTASPQLWKEVSSPFYRQGNGALQGRWACTG